MFSVVKFVTLYVSSFMCDILLVYVAPLVLLLLMCVYVCATVVYVSDVAADDTRYVCLTYNLIEENGKMLPHQRENGITDIFVWFVIRIDKTIHAQQANCRRRRRQ